MRIKPSTKIHAMLRIHPQLEEVLEDHDLDVDGINAMSIRQACNDADLDPDEVLEDLKAALRDSATEGWLSVEEDDDSDDDYEDDDDEEDDYYAAATAKGAAAGTAAAADGGDEEGEDDDDGWD